MKIVYYNTDALIPYEKNPRQNDAAVEVVAQSIEEFGFKQPIVIDKNNVVIAGHTRLKAAKQLGLSKVPCLLADDLTSEQVQAYRLVDNKAAELSNWNYDLLKEELAVLSDSFDMEDFGFSLDELSLDALNEIEENPDKLEELKADDPISKVGQIWQLGNHRLMVGDSTKSDDVLTLMNGLSADLLVTDPPYNVNYTGSTKEKLTIINDNMSDGQFTEFLSAAFINAASVLKPGGCFYIWHADTKRVEFVQALNSAKLEQRQTLVWVKNTATLSRQDYNWKHETCIYGWKDGAAHYYCNDFTQTTVIQEDKPLQNSAHPTMKPVALFARHISNSSKSGDVVLDLFAGSGTTMVACEKLGRRAFLMEYDPSYADAIIQRYEELTNQEAILLK